MTLTIQDVSIYVGLFLFCVKVFHYVCVAPTNRAMYKMESTLAKLDETLDGHTERLARVEESAKSAHKRIDGLERGA